MKLLRKRYHVNEAVVFLYFVVLCVLMANLVFYALVYYKVQPFANMYAQGFTILAKPNAWVFAHGSYENYTGGFAHTIYLNHATMWTEDYARYLHDEGYKYIWFSSCETGKSQYMTNLSYYVVENVDTVFTKFSIDEFNSSEWNITHQEKQTAWLPYVDRASCREGTSPVWVLIGFIRFCS